MSLKPLSFRQIEEQTGDIYEAVVVMERRAKQILRDRLVEKIIKKKKAGIWVFLMKSLMK